LRTALKRTGIKRNNGGDLVERRRKFIRKQERERKESVGSVGQKEKSQEGKKQSHYAFPTIKISNLNYTISIQELFGLFQNESENTSMKIYSCTFEHKPKESKDLVTAVVSFHKREDAEKIKQDYDGATLDNNKLTIQWC
jgi:RNA recognition motif. (a.k.a. RRM, RBD, or RNP domain)